MSELAPGFYVDDWMLCGKVFRFQAGLFFNHAGPVVALHPDEWARIPGVDRERLLDELTRADAIRGQRLIEAELAKVATQKRR